MTTYRREENAHPGSTGPAVELLARATESLDIGTLLVRRAVAIPVNAPMERFAGQCGGLLSFRDAASDQVLRLNDDNGHERSFHLGRVPVDGDTDAILVQDVPSGRQRRPSDVPSAQQRGRPAPDARNRFLANMCHELRTPLNTIEGLAHELANYRVDERGRRISRALWQASNHLTTLLGDLLALSTIETGYFEPVQRPCDLKTLYEETMATLDVQARLQGLHLHLDYRPATPRFFVSDPLYLRQILFHLVTNRLAFVSRGEIRVVVCALQATPRTARPLEIRVADTGPGIAPAQMAQVFAPFEPAPEGHPLNGHGLGLAVPHELARLMGGDITVESVRGQGTTLRVHLILPEATASEANDLLRGKAGEIRPRRSLIVDDVPINRHVLRRLLEHRGWHVEAVDSGESCLALLRGGARYDVIFMDISMPRMDGIETTRRLKAQPKWRSIPVVALTAHVLPGDRERFIAAGMDGYVPKPVDNDRLWAEVGPLLRDPAESEALAHTVADEGYQHAAVAGPMSSSAALGTALPSDPATPPIDLDKLLELCGNDPTTVNDVLGALLRSGPQWLKGATEAVGAGDGPQIREICHTVVGTAGTIRAHELEHAAADLGRLAREGLLERTPAALERLREAFERLEGWLQTLPLGPLRD